MTASGGSGRSVEGSTAFKIFRCFTKAERVFSTLTEAACMQMLLSYLFVG